jgi:DNA-binding transcriptional ArsR family regulator
MRTLSQQKKTRRTDAEALRKAHSQRHQDWRSVAVLAKGLSDENRLRILLCLVPSRKSVSKIVEEVGLSQPLVSHHLKELKRCLLVDIEREGPFIYYSLADSQVVDALNMLGAVAANLIASRKSL